MDPTTQTIVNSAAVIAATSATSNAEGASAAAQAGGGGLLLYCFFLAMLAGLLAAAPVALSRRLARADDCGWLTLSFAVGTAGGLLPLGPDMGRPFVVLVLGVWACAGLFLTRAALPEGAAGRSVAAAYAWAIWAASLVAGEAVAVSWAIQRLK